MVFCFSILSLKLLTCNEVFMIMICVFVKEIFVCVFLISKHAVVAQEGVFEHPPTPPYSHTDTHTCTLLQSKQKISQKSVIFDIYFFLLWPIQKTIIGLSVLPSFIFLLMLPLHAYTYFGQFFQ